MKAKLMQLGKDAKTYFNIMAAHTVGADLRSSRGMINTTGHTRSTSRAIWHEHTTRRTQQTRMS